MICRISKEILHFLQQISPLRPRFIGNFSFRIYKVAASNRAENTSKVSQGFLFNPYFYFSSSEAWGVHTGGIFLPFLFTSCSLALASLYLPAMIYFDT